METNLDTNIVLTSLKSFGQKLGKWIGVGGFDTRRPNLVSLVAEEHVPVVRIDSAGEICLVHLRTLESKVHGVVVDDSRGGGVGREIFCSVGHGGN